VYVHNLLSVKSFHGVLSDNVHECSLKPSIGKVRVILSLAENIILLGWRAKVWSRKLKSLSDENKVAETIRGLKAW
jgi:hypothetical protein